MNRLTSEDDVVKTLINCHHMQDGFVVAAPEEHYNHYGDRGVVDLFVEHSVFDGHRQWVYEVKSEAAVREVTGANEILRQFNRMKKYFFKRTDHEPGSQVFYNLTFVPTEYTLQHIKENYSIYEQSMGFEENATGKIRDAKISIAHSDMGIGGIEIRSDTLRTASSQLMHVNPDLAAELSSVFNEV